MKLSQIKANPNNPRVLRDEKFQKLKKSIEEFPKMMELRPIVIDENNTILGGNMRFRALQDLGYKEIEDSWVKKANELTEKQKQEFIIKDNVSFGEWNWDDLVNEWDLEDLKDWGLDMPGFEINAEELGTDFSLPDGDKAPFQQMTFTLADEQAEFIKAKLADIKKSEEFKYVETFGNENSNGNALYLALNG